MFKLLRLDERLIHGQVAFAWTNSLSADCILVANDGVAKDKLRATSLKLAAPAEVKFVVKSVEDAIKALNGHKTDKYKLFILVDNTKDALALVSAVEEVDHVNLGNMKVKEGTKTWTPSVSVTAEDVENIKGMIEHGAEVYASSVLSIAVAIQSGTGVGTAVALALPLSIFLQMWRNFCYAIPGSWAGKQIEKAVNERNIKKANLLHLTVVPLSIGIPSALLVFVAVAFGADTINTVLNAIPTVVMDGFNVAAGVLSCVGLALLIKMMSNSKVLPYLFLGFICVIYLGMDVIGVAVAGLCIAFIAVSNMKFDTVEEEDF
jgi:phosphotransferase system PTS sorbose-specific IIC subunit